MRMWSVYTYDHDVVLIGIICKLCCVCRETFILAFDFQLRRTFVCAWFWTHGLNNRMFCLILSGWSFIKVCFLYHSPWLGVSHQGAFSRVVCCQDSFLSGWIFTRVSSGCIQDSFLSGWIFTRVVSHQGAFIRVVCHQDNFLSGWIFTRVVSHQGGPFSAWLLIIMVSHQACLLLGW